MGVVICYFTGKEAILSCLVPDTPAPYIITTRFKLYATPKYSWGSDPYPEYSISMDPATFDQNNMSHKFSNEIHECWYCKQNLSNYALLLKHAEKEHQDFTSDPDQSLLGTEYYGRKRGRATRRRRTKRFNPNRTVRSTKFTRRTKARTIKTTIRDENWNSDRELDSSEWYEGKTKHMRYKNEDSLDSKGNPVNMSNYIHF